MAIKIKPSHKGLLHEDLGVAQGKPIPAGKLAKAKKSKNPAVKKRAVFAANAKKWHHGAKHATQPHPETNPGYYDSEPHAPADKIADKPAYPTPTVGNRPSHIVPGAPGRFPGMGGQPHSMGKPPMQSHGYGHLGSQRHGHMRLSGHSGSHRIGKK